MPEIKPDLSDKSRCISVHWTLPVQCVLPPGHRENNHEAWHPQTRNRIRYRRTMGVYRTEELNDGWRELEIAPPGGYCGYPHTTTTGVACQEMYGHALSWQHRAKVDGCLYSWNTPIPLELDRDQLHHDVRHMRAAVHRLSSEREQVAAALADFEQGLIYTQGLVARLREIVGQPAETAVAGGEDR